MLPCRVYYEEFLNEWESELHGCFIGIRLKTQELFIVEFQEEKSKMILPILISTHNLGILEAYSSKKNLRCRIGVINYHYQGSTRYKLLWIM